MGNNYSIMMIEELCWLVGSGFDYHSTGFRISGLRFLEHIFVVIGFRCLFVITILLNRLLSMNSEFVMENVSN